MRQQPDRPGPRTLRRLGALGVGLASVLLLAACGSESEDGGVDREGSGGETATVTQSPSPGSGTPGSGTPGSGTPTENTPPAGSAVAVTSLTIRYESAPGAGAQVWTLTCGPDGGSHPDAAAACAMLARLAVDGVDPFAPTPKNQPCTMVYGGPDVGTVTGTWNGRKVSATFSKENGCEIARWLRVAPMLPDNPQISLGPD